MASKAVPQSWQMYSKIGMVGLTTLLFNFGVCDPDVRAAGR
jgi:hypothetical protein